MTQYWKTFRDQLLYRWDIYMGKAHWRMEYSRDFERSSYWSDWYPYSTVMTLATDPQYYTGKVEYMRYPKVKGPNKIVVIHVADHD